MSVNLKLNGPVSLHIWLIFLFPMKFHSHLSWNVPWIEASEQYTTDTWEMAQYIGRWAWYQVGNNKMSVMLKLNGPLLFYLFIIFLFHFLYLLIFYAMTLNSRFITIDYYMEMAQHIERWAWYQFENRKMSVKLISKDLCWSIFGACSYFKPFIMPILHTVYQTYYWSLLDCYGEWPNILDVEHDTNLIIGRWMWI